MSTVSIALIRSFASVLICFTLVGSVCFWSGLEQAGLKEYAPLYIFR